DAFGGGSIKIDALKIALLTLGSPMGFIANGSGSGSGGAVTMNAQSIVIQDNANVFLQANADGEGNGGSITVNASGSNAELQFGAGPNQINVSAFGGSIGSQGGNGGSVTLQSGRNMFVALDESLNAGPLGDNGNGARLSLTVTSGQPCCGQLVVFGDLRADGVGTGAGGSISISVNSRIPFVIGVLAANNVANGISAFFVTPDSGRTPGQNNNGGTLSIVHHRS